MHPEGHEHEGVFAADSGSAVGDEQLSDVEHWLGRSEFFWDKNGRVNQHSGD